MQVKIRPVRLVVTFLIFGVVCFSLKITLKNIGWSRLTSLDKSAINYVDLLSDNPIRIHPEPVQVDLPINRDKLVQYAALIATTVPSEQEGSARSRLLHVTRLYEFVPSLSNWLERDNKGIITRVLIDASAFSPSWRGLDIVETADGQLSEHRDQMLSSLAELGVPLSASIGAGTKVYKVRDLLCTSMNEFHLKQREIEWTAVAYAHYLPPQSHWKN